MVTSSTIAAISKFSMSQFTRTSVRLVVLCQLRALSDAAGHHTLNVSHSARHVGEVLAARGRDQHVIFDADAAGTAEASQRLLVDEGGAHRVGKRLV